MWSKVGVFWGGISYHKYLATPLAFKDQGRNNCRLPKRKYSYVPVAQEAVELQGLKVRSIHYWTWATRFLM